VSRPARTTVSGHYAGPVTRAVGAVLDGLVVTTTFTLGYAGLNYLANAFLGDSFHLDRSAPLAVAALAGWAFLYMFGSLMITGRTVGMAVAGLRVVSAEGLAPSVRSLFVRTLAYPLSAALLGIGFLLIVVQREHRALHDLIAGTAVVYDWADRPAEMPGPLSDFLNRSGAPVPEPSDSSR
jgi:uncharacterized RDD family membrane protein YckC